ncbi:excinuclease ABC subunit B [bacterium CG10_37_50]|nr:MAG: excinuclease ABC subunit B [bacterium CG10_37_50]
MIPSKFNLISPFKPSGDQPQAIKELIAGLKAGDRFQTLLGVTGSGKTFTSANVIATINKPTLVIAHNKTLASQLAEEYKTLFPNNAVHYFVSYYDYYQPEAYIASSDTYIEKDASINEEIERLRHASTQSLLTRRDVIVVASVSCIYGLGSPAEYLASHLRFQSGQKISRQEILTSLINLYYERTIADLKPGMFRALGNSIEIMPPGERELINFQLNNDGIAEIIEYDAITRVERARHQQYFLFPAKHFITSASERERAIKVIKTELEEQLAKFIAEGKLLEAERLKRRTNYDLALIREIGYCNGIENYSRPLSGRKPGSPPETLLDYFPKKRRSTRTGRGQTQIIEEADFLTIIDESHVTVPQIGGMYAGDASRKKSLVENGFRLPSAYDNRPLRFPEFEARIGQVIFTSATPGQYEGENSTKIVEQIIRPTGLVDPAIEVRPILSTPPEAGYRGQIKDFIAEAKKDISAGGRVIATTLTKKMAEDLSEYLKTEGLKAEYLHSEIKTLERIKILTAFRQGSKNGGFDCLVGVNLLREGLDLPELSFIGILDADKEGFLRSEVALIQTIGRAARNVAGRVILYADNVTGSMKRAIEETNRRRDKQLAYNKKHHISPQTIIKKISDLTEGMNLGRAEATAELFKIETAGLDKRGIKKLLKVKEKEMSSAVRELDFETAAILRDEIKAILHKLEVDQVRLTK